MKKYSCNKIKKSAQCFSSNFEYSVQIQKLKQAKNGQSSRQILAKINQIIFTTPTFQKKQSSKKNNKQQICLNFSPQRCQCKCKKTHCLKLYCDCFSQGKYCFGCSCQQCQNISEYDEHRSNIIDRILFKNPHVFDSSIRVNRCICQKTNCMKKYCQCYNNGLLCSSSCKCLNCFNNQNINKKNQISNHKFVQYNSNHQNQDH